MGDAGGPPSAFSAPNCVDSLATALNSASIAQANQSANSLAMSQSTAGTVVPPSLVPVSPSGTDLTAETGLAPSAPAAAALLAPTPGLPVAAVPAAIAIPGAVPAVVPAAATAVLPALVPGQPALVPSGLSSMLQATPAAAPSAATAVLAAALSATAEGSSTDGSKGMGQPLANGMGADQMAVEADTTGADKAPDLPPADSNLGASPISVAAANALASAVAASAAAQQQQEQLQQAQVQQFMAQQQMRQQLAQQQQQAMMAASPNSSAAMTAELTAAGFPAAAAAFAAQQQQQIQQQQQQLQQQQQMMTAAGLSTATAFVPTGATPAQLAQGMPAVQAVSVLVPSGQSTSQGMSQPLTSQVLAQPSSTLSSSSLASAALNQALGASGASMLTAATPMASGSSTAASTCSELSNALTKLAVAQHQHQQQQQAAAMLQAAASSASSSNLLPSVASNMSLGNLKSASIASSVLSTLPTSTLEPIPSAAPSSSSSMSAGKVRVLLSSGGEYEEVVSNEGATGGRSSRWRYVGGETRLVGLKRTNSFSPFLQQLSKATSAVWDENCRLMYDLPSGEVDTSGTLVDLIDDEDLEMMWEELDVMLASKPTFRLHIYVQLGSKRGSSGPAESSIASEEHMSDFGSTPKAAAAVAAATAAAANVGNSSGSTGAPRPADGRNSSGSNRGAAAEPSGPVAGSSGTAVTFNSSEYDELVEDIVTDKPTLNLTDLEAKLDIIHPEDLTPVRLLGSGGFGEVYLCRWHSSDVAVKCLNPNLLVPDGGMGSISKDNVSELLREANLLGSVRHPNIVFVYGLVLPPMDAAVEAVRSALGPGQGIDAVKVTMQMANKHRNEAPLSALRPPALVTEYLASGSLRAAITRKADFVTRDSVKIKLALDAARGMDYLHCKHIVHFDLKTANLLVGMRDKAPICKVADFGLSKQKQQTYVTGVATLRGTLPWIAPEIIKTPSSVTEAVDVWSFGVVLWELWTLREPFEGINYHALLHMMSTSNEAVRPPLPGAADFEGEAGPEPAAGWADMISECWESEPEKRPTFRQLVQRLETMLRQNRMLKKRSASVPPGTGCATSTPESVG